MNKILIIGENSFVGNNIKKVSKNERINEISIVEKKPEEINLSEYDTLIHLAAIVHQSKKIPGSEYYRVNRDLTVETAKQAKRSGVKQFIFLSTIKVYGDFSQESVPWDEKSECVPNDPYSKSKYDAEQGLQKLEDKNFIVSIIRTPIVYGSGVKANMLSILKLTDKMKILPFGNVKNKRNFTYVKNLVEFIDKVIEKRASGVFIAMDDKPLSTTDLVRLISKYLNKKIFLITLPKHIINTGRKLAPKVFDRLYGSLELNNSQTLKTLGFNPKYTSEEGIRDMCMAYLDTKNKKN